MAIVPNMMPSAPRSPMANQLCASIALVEPDLSENIGPLVRTRLRRAEQGGKSEAREERRVHGLLSLLRAEPAQKTRSRLKTRPSQNVTSQFANRYAESAEEGRQSVELQRRTLVHANYRPDRLYAPR